MLIFIKRLDGKKEQFDVNPESTTTADVVEKLADRAGIAKSQIRLIYKVCCWRHCLYAYP